MSSLAEELAQGFQPSYVGRRSDVVSLIPKKTQHLLDLGCSIGALGKFAKETLGNLRVTGIELDHQMASVASEVLDEVHVGDLNTLDLREVVGAQEFDCITMADILEHTANPWRIVREAATLLSPIGVVVTSIPNVRHISTLFALAVQGKFPYRDRGIHDKTHIRFFARSNILDLLSAAGLSVIKEKRNLRLIEAVSRVNKAAKFLDVPGLRPLLTFQYIHVSTQANRDP